MHTFDGKSNRLTFSVLLFLLAWIVTSCDETPIVGGDFSPDDVMVNADTIAISNLSLASSPSFSGNLSYVTAGAVNDPVFGEITTVALLRPRIVREAQVDTIGENPSARLTLDISNRYGSTTIPAVYHIVELARPWRSTSWRYDSIPDLAKNPDLSEKIIGQFTLTEEDSISVRLDDDWARRYREIFLMPVSSERDSLYRVDLPGLAIVPAAGTDMMFSVQPSRSRLVIASGGGLRDVTSEMNSWAVSKERKETDSHVRSSMPVFNTMTSMLEIDINFSEEFLGTTNFSRVEMVIYDDTLGMQQGTPPDFVRPRSETIIIFLLEPDQLFYSIAADPRFQANRREEDSSFRVPLTSFANERIRSGASTRKFYAITGSNDGRILPALLAGPEDAHRHPRLLITSISRSQ